MSGKENRRFFLEEIILIILFAVAGERSFAQDSLFIKETDLSLLHINFGKGSFLQSSNGDLITLAPEFIIGEMYTPFILTRQTINGDHLWSIRLSNGYSYSGMTEDANKNIYIVISDTMSHSQIIKLNSDGQEQWRRVCDEISFSKDVHVIGNSVYLIGSADPGGSNYLYFMSKFDMDGNLIWSKYLSIGYHIEMSKSILTSDNQILITSNYDQSLMFVENQLHIMKVDTNANVSWSKRMDVIDDHEVFDIHETNAGEFVLTGAIYTPYPDIFFTRISANGEVLASTYYHQEMFQEAFGIEQTSDGNFMICAEPEAYFNKTVPQVAMLKIDEDGTVMDFTLQHISGAGFFPFGFSLRDTFFYISGIRLDSYHLMTIKTNEQGYTKCADRPDSIPVTEEILVAIDKLVYDGAGPNFTPSIGNQIFISASTQTICSALAVEPEVIHYLPEVPNVFTPDDDGINDFFEIEYPYEEGFEIVIIDRWGQIVFTGNSPTQPWDGIVQPSLDKATAGVYFYHLKVGDLSKHGFLTLIR